MEQKWRQLSASLRRSCVDSEQESNLLPNLRGRGDAETKI